MTRKEKAEQVQAFLDERFGKVPCFLHHRNDCEFLIAVMLSAQATDASVNAVTPSLFSQYPSLLALSRAPVEEIEAIVRPVGLAHTKSRNVKRTAGILLREYGGEIPRDREKLMSLPGVGYKTSGVVLGELYNFPYLPVDTHVERVSKLLGLVDGKLPPEKIEPKLEKLFSSACLINTHKQLILLGRTILTARHPRLEELPFPWLKVTASGRRDRKAP